jgi:hypothetical protein
VSTEPSARTNARRPPSSTNFPSGKSEPRIVEPPTDTHAAFGACSAARAAGCAAAGARGFAVVTTGDCAHAPANKDDHAAAVHPRPSRPSILMVYDRRVSRGVTAVNGANG